MLHVGGHQEAWQGLHDVEGTPTKLILIIKMLSIKIIKISLYSYTTVKHTIIIKKIV
jgi:hypothetical protein